ncbi:hypothetical protein KIPB_016153, partial [Kipferlia bialata]
DDDPFDPEINWRRLGHVSLGDNSKSAYKGRERQSITLNLTLRTMRLVMHEPHPTKYNPYNQVSLVSLVFTGNVLDPHVAVDFTHAEKKYGKY